MVNSLLMGRFLGPTTPTTALIPNLFRDLVIQNTVLAVGGLSKPIYRPLTRARTGALASPKGEAKDRKFKIYSLSFGRGTNFS